MSRSENTIPEALDAAYEYSVAPGMYVLAPEKYPINRGCPEHKDVGVVCTSTFGIGASPNVDVDTQLSGRLNTMPRGLYGAPPVPLSDPSPVGALNSEALPEMAHSRFKGSLRGLAEGPVYPRIGSEWIFGINPVDPAKIIPEHVGLHRGGYDARLSAKDSA